MTKPDSLPTTLLKGGWSALTRRPASQQPALDAFRAVAVLLVICTHYPWEWTVARGPEVSYIRWPVFYYGWTGVDLFFVLSGLLIGGEVWREVTRTGTINVWRFSFLRRGLRIWPLYFVVLGLLEATGFHTRRADWVFLSNYLKSGYERSWSLSTEEQFYLVVPLLLILIARTMRRAWRAWPIVALIALVPVVRLFTQRHLQAAGLSPEVIHERMVFPIHLHAEGLLIGLLLAWITVERPHWIAREPAGRVSRRGLVVLACGVSLGLALDIANKDLFAFTALGLIFGSCVYMALVDRSWVTRPLHAYVFFPIARLSYGMYLNHFLVLPGSTAWALRHAPGPLPVKFFAGLLLGTVISIAAAAVTFLLVEHPFLELRRAILGRGARVPSASPVVPVQTA